MSPELETTHTTKPSPGLTTGIDGEDALVPQPSLLFMRRVEWLEAQAVCSIRSESEEELGMGAVGFIPSPPPPDVTNTPVHTGGEHTDAKPWWEKEGTDMSIRNLFSSTPYPTAPPHYPVESCGDYGPTRRDVTLLYTTR